MPLYRHAQPVPERERIRREHAEWSDATFGDVGPIGPLKHLSKEALEAAAVPSDPLEWADMQFLLWDAQRRAGISDGEITLAMKEKLAVNKKREWPEPKDGEPRLHIKKPPVPVVPEEIEPDSNNTYDYVDGWSACRAAMLQGGEPVSQTYELPQTQLEQVADLYEMQFDDGRTCAFHTDGAKAAQWLLACDGNKVQEYVRIERYQDAVIGNIPVQSPIDHGYRPECECSGCKATARICAELNNEEAEIFADGYNAAMQSFGNSEQLNSPVTPDGWISCSELMPEDEQEVIVHNKLGYRYVSYFDEHSGLFFDMRGGNQMNCIEHILVTHWMPLPAAPQH
ncbi:DUF550 domain-containing protein [Salmonella enterica]|nr:DUF550 domain-containing protein [Salmonella enterica]EEU4860065.1 DUF550 domain-containing protein [Salmonella enterica]EEU4864984.1 DUF550 domain-containing protein [Salmonella enterica]EEU4874750.1 DUF550 domain-containing protein [Salmonella enterica]EEU4890803.1 DUF550 domain-containing protein [Salmonella enterica]